MNGGSKIRKGKYNFAHLKGRTRGFSYCLFIRLIYNLALLLAAILAVEDPCGFFLQFTFRILNTHSIDTELNSVPSYEENMRKHNQMKMTI
jgi:hypothetical protein